MHYPGAVVDPDTGTLVSDAEVAEVTYTAFTSTKTPVTARLVVRRVRDRAKTAELFPVWRHQPLLHQLRRADRAGRHHPPPARHHRNRVRRPDRRTPGPPALSVIPGEQCLGDLRAGRPPPAVRRRSPGQPCTRRRPRRHGWPQARREDRRHRPSTNRILSDRMLVVEYARLSWTAGARKHPVSRTQVRHLISQAGLYFVRPAAPPERPDEDAAGVRLEVVGVELTDGGLRVIHAMAMRRAYEDLSEEARKWRL